MRRHFPVSLAVIKTGGQSKEIQNKGAQGEIQNKKRRGPRRAVWKMLPFECKVNQDHESVKEANKRGKNVLWLTLQEPKTRFKSSLLLISSRKVGS